DEDHRQEADPAGGRRLADDARRPSGGQARGRSNRGDGGEAVRGELLLGNRRRKALLLAGGVSALRRAVRYGRRGRRRLVGHQMQPVGVRGGMIPGWPRATGSGPSVILPVSRVRTPAPSTLAEKRSMLRGAGPYCVPAALIPSRSYRDPWQGHSSQKFFRHGFGLQPRCGHRWYRPRTFSDEPSPLVSSPELNPCRPGSKRTTYARASGTYAGNPSAIGRLELASFRSSSVPIRTLLPKPPVRFGQMKPIVPAVTSRSHKAIAPPI